MLDTCARLGQPVFGARPGQARARVLADARKRMAEFLGCQGANWCSPAAPPSQPHGLAGRAGSPRGQGRQRMLSSAWSTRACWRWRAAWRDGASGGPDPVDAQGRSTWKQRSALIGDDVALVSVMGANNETGV
jgi:cysteine desulfurase